MRLVSYRRRMISVNEMRPRKHDGTKQIETRRELILPQRISTIF
jgi:hypothetical protein